MLWAVMHKALLGIKFHSVCDKMCLSLFGVSVMLSKHMENNSQTSVPRGRESQEQPMLVLPVQLAWRGMGEGTVAFLVSERPSCTASGTISEAFSY